MKHLPHLQELGSDLWVQSVDVVKGNAVLGGDAQQCLPRFHGVGYDPRLGGEGCPSPHTGVRNQQLLTNLQALRI